MFDGTARNESGLPRGLTSHSAALAWRLFESIIRHIFFSRCSSSQLSQNIHRSGGIQAHKTKGMCSFSHFGESEYISLDAVYSLDFGSRLDETGHHLRYNATGLAPAAAPATPERITEVDPTPAAPMLWSAATPHTPVDIMPAAVLPAAIPPAPKPRRPTATGKAAMATPAPAAPAAYGIHQRR